MTREHVLAGEQMTAAQAKLHEEEKHTGIRKEKRKVGSQAGALVTRSAIFLL